MKERERAELLRDLVGCLPEGFEARPVDETPWTVLARVEVDPVVGVGDVEYVVSVLREQGYLPVLDYDEGVEIKVNMMRESIERVLPDRRSDR